MVSILYSLVSLWVGWGEFIMRSRQVKRNLTRHLCSMGLRYRILLNIQSISGEFW